MLLEYKKGILFFLEVLNNLLKTYPYPKPAISSRITNMPIVKIRLNSSDITFEAILAIAITIIIRLTKDESKVIVFLAGMYLSSSNLKTNARTAGANIDKAKSLNMDNARSGDAIPIK